MADANTKIKTILSADSTDFEAGIKRAAATLQQAEGKFKQSTKNMTNSLGDVNSSVEKLAKGFGIALGVREVIGFGKEVLEVADRLQTLQDRTGVSAVVLRRFQGDVENSGGSLDDLGNAIQKMQIKLGLAEGGSKSAANAIKSIGLEIEDLKGLSPDEQFTKVATAISNIEDPTQRAAAAFTVFGKGAAPLLPFLDDFAEKEANATTWTDKLTESMGPDTIQILDDFGDSINTLSIRLTNLSAKALAGVTVAISTLRQQIAQVGILAGKNAGLIDPEIADYALEDVGKQLDNANNPTQDPARAKKKKNASNRFIAPDAIAQGQTDADKAQKDAAKLTDAIAKLRDESQHALDTDGLNEYDKAMSDIQFKAQQLANQYHTDLTPADQEMINAAKAAAVAQIDLGKQLAINKQLGSDIGNAFGDAFEDAALGAKKLSDVVTDLGQAIEKALFNAVVTAPLNDFFKSAFSSGGAASGGLSGIFDGIGSFFGLAGGGNINAGQTTLVGEKGPELFTPRSQGQVIPNSAIGAGGGTNVTIINNTPSKVSAKSQQSGNQTDLVLQIDQIVGQLATQKGSATSQALQSRENRTLIRR